MDTARSDGYLTISIIILVIKFCLIFIHTWLIPGSAFVQTTHAQDYNFGSSTGIHFRANLFQPVSKWTFLLWDPSILLKICRWKYSVCIRYDISKLIKILESKSEVVIDRFKKYKMAVTKDRFQAIILYKRKRNHSDELVTVDNHQVKIVSSVKILGLQLDEKLNFNLFIATFVNLLPTN